MRDSERDTGSRKNGETGSSQQDSSSFESESESESEAMHPAEVEEAPSRETGPETVGHDEAQIGDASGGSEATGLALVEKNGGDPDKTRWHVEKPGTIPGLNSNVVWLEEGGWNHILERHKDDFIRKYDSINDESDIEHYIKKAVENPESTSKGKDGKAKMVYRITVNGDPFWVIIRSNGFIQSAYPRG